MEDMSELKRVLARCGHDEEKLEEMEPSAKSSDSSSRKLQRINKEDTNGGHLPRIVSSFSTTFFG